MFRPHSSSQVLRLYQTGYYPRIIAHRGAKRPLSRRRLSHYTPGPPGQSPRPGRGAYPPGTPSRSRPDPGSVFVRTERHETYPTLDDGPLSGPGLRLPVGKRETGPTIPVRPRDLRPEEGCGTRRPDGERRGVRGPRRSVPGPTREYSRSLRRERRCDSVDYVYGRGEDRRLVVSRDGRSLWDPRLCGIPVRPVYGGQCQILCFRDSRQGCGGHSLPRTTSKTSQETVSTLRVPTSVLTVRVRRLFLPFPRTPRDQERLVSDLPTTLIPGLSVGRKTPVPPATSHPHRRHPGFPSPQFLSSTTGRTVGKVLPSGPLTGGRRTVLDSRLCGSCPSPRRTSSAGRDRVNPYVSGGSGVRHPTRVSIRRPVQTPIPERI